VWDGSSRRKARVLRRGVGIYPPDRTPLAAFAACTAHATSHAATKVFETRFSSMIPVERPHESAHPTIDEGRSHETRFSPLVVSVATNAVPITDVIG
jgi:hypothetical protein